MALTTTTSLFTDYNADPSLGADLQGALVNAVTTITALTTLEATATTAATTATTAAGVATGAANSATTNATSAAASAATASSGASSATAAAASISGSTTAAASSAASAASSATAANASAVAAASASSGASSASSAAAVSATAAAASATAAALTASAMLASPTFTGTVTLPALVVTGTETVGGINTFQIVGGAPGFSPSLSPVGPDTNIGIEILTKGTGSVGVSGNFAVSGVSGFTGFTNLAGSGWLGGGSPNYLWFQGAASGSAPSLTALGVDTNVGITLVPQGGGAVSTNGSPLKIGAATTSQIAATGIGVTATAVDSWPLASGHTARVTLSAEQTTGSTTVWQTTEFLVLCDGINVTILPFAFASTSGAAIAAVSASLSGSTVSITVQAGTGTVSASGVRTLISI